MNETDVASYVDDNTSNVVGNNIKRCHDQFTYTR